LSFHSSEQGIPLMPSLGEFNVKCMLTLFFDTHRGVYYEFVPKLYWNITTLTTCDICETVYCQSDLKSEIYRIAFPAVRTQLITLLFLCVNFGLRTNDLFHTLPTHQM
jgi:hypothetical protein